jgi:hypothetical protein
MFKQATADYLFQNVILGKSRWRSLMNAIRIWCGFKPTVQKGGEVLIS